MNYDEWITELVSEELGHLWLSKFNYDLSVGNLPRLLEKTFRTLVETKLATVPLGYPALSVVESVINENPGSCDLKGQRIPADLEPYSLIVKLEAFAQYYLRRRVLMTVTDESDGDVEFVWENLGTVITPRFYEGWVKTERDFFWCAPTRVVLEIIDSCLPNLGATRLRSRLGLHLMGKGQRIIRIDIPPAALAGKRFSAPTTLDSGVNPAFVPFNSADGYGRTLNLKRIRRDIQELVIEKLPFDLNFTANKVGRVGSRLPTILWARIVRLLT